MDIFKELRRQDEIYSHFKEMADKGIEINIPSFLYEASKELANRYFFDKNKKKESAILNVMEVKIK